MGIILLHVIPMSALLAGARRAAAAELLEYKDNLRPIDARFGFSYFVNFHGLVTYNSNAKNEFLQINRNGIVETAKAGIVLDIGAANKVDIIKVVPQSNIEIMIVGALASILPAINDLGFAPPHVVLITLSGVRGAQVDINTWRDKKLPITEDELYFDEVIFEDLPQNYQAVARAMRPAFDQLSNAGGEPKSPNFDATGEWKLRPRT